MVGRKCVGSYIIAGVAYLVIISVGLKFVQYGVPTCHVTFVPVRLVKTLSHSNYKLSPPMHTGTSTDSSNRTRLVMKFGGTSLGTAERLLAISDIIDQSNQSFHPILVCSAISSIEKTRGTTSLLIKAAELCLHAREEASFLAVVDTIQSNHLYIASTALSSHIHILEYITTKIKDECLKLKQFLHAIRIIDEISPKSKDVIVSTGEILSCWILSAVLQSRNIQTVVVDATSIIEPEWQDVDVDQHFYDYVSRRLKHTIANEKHRIPEPYTHTEIIPIVTGFIGPVPGSLLGSVGRGYTDLTAALIAVGMQVYELQIWKEVDGIFTADPRKVPSAKLIPTITPDEAAELTYYGSEVIHPFTMDQVIRAGIPIRIKNTFNPSGVGTLVCPVDQRNGVDPHLIGYQLESLNITNGQANGHLKTFTLKTPTAVTIKDGIIMVNIRSNSKSNSHGFLRSIFETLDRFGVVVDLITTSEVHVSIAIPCDTDAESIGDNDSPGLDQNSSSFRSSTGDGEPKFLNKVLIEFRKLGTVTVHTRQAILSVVGRYMRNTVGTAGKIFSILANEDVNIEMISQGASEINISCVIAQNASERALRAVHDRLVLGIVVSHGNNPPIVLHDMF